MIGIALALEDLHPLIAEADVIVVCQLIGDRQYSLRGNAVLLVLTARGSSGGVYDIAEQYERILTSTDWAYIDRFYQRTTIADAPASGGYIGGIAILWTAAALFRRDHTDDANRGC